MPIIAAASRCTPRRVIDEDVAAGDAVDVRRRSRPRPAPGSTVSGACRAGSPRAAALDLRCAERAQHLGTRVAGGLGELDEGLFRWSSAASPPVHDLYRAPVAVAARLARWAGTWPATERDALGAGTPKRSTSPGLSASSSSTGMWREATSARTSTSTPRAPRRTASADVRVDRRLAELAAREMLGAPARSARCGKDERDGRGAFVDLHLHGQHQRRLARRRQVDVGDLRLEPSR